MSCLPWLLGAGGAPQHHQLRKGDPKSGQRSGRSRGPNREQWLEGEHERLVKVVRRLQDEHDELQRTGGKHGAPRHHGSESASEGGGLHEDVQHSDDKMHNHSAHTDEVATKAAGALNKEVMRGSALSYPRPVQAVIYLLAFAGAGVILWATANYSGANDATIHHDLHHDIHDTADPHHAGSVGHGEQQGEVHHDDPLAGGRDNDGRDAVAARERREHIPNRSHASTSAGRADATSVDAGRPLAHDAGSQAAGGASSHAHDEADGPGVNDGAAGSHVSDEDLHGATSSTAAPALAHHHGGGGHHRHEEKQRDRSSGKTPAKEEHAQEEEQEEGAMEGETAGAGAHGRQLFAQAASLPLMKNIAVTLTGCGLIALVVNLLGQPLILGYLLGGVLVGPIGLNIVHSHVDIAGLSSLGLIFLLFMIGLELDVVALLKMGKVVLLVGFLQFPVCAGLMGGIFMGLEGAGISFGRGSYAAMYTGMTCGISSTMIVVKLLSEKAEMGTEPGRLTIGILIFQDIWAIVVLAIQPNLANPEILGILRTFAMIVVLIGIALAYAKFIMPVVLYQTSSNLELMLVMSLAWCFFVGCVAILPFIGLSMELASLIAGVALATFPYSAEFNGKIKYIRDFFITLFFAALGMQIPVPSLTAIATGALVGVVVIVIRWVGIFLLVFILGGGARLGVISTLNLSQVSEFALVICSLGMGFGHIEEDTMTIIIWTFAMLGIAASYMIQYNETVYLKLAALANRLRGNREQDHHDGHHGHGEHHDHRDILLLGFHNVATSLVAEIRAKSPQLLKRMHIVSNKQDMVPKLREIGLTCAYGDISSPDVLEHAFHGEPKLVICSIPDSQLIGTNNRTLVRMSKGLWTNAFVIATADSPEQARVLYKTGADYVVKVAKLNSKRLVELIFDNRLELFGGGDLSALMDQFKKRDLDSHTATLLGN